MTQVYADAIKNVQTPEQVVSDFYHWYVYPNETYDKNNIKLQHYVSDDLLININLSVQCNYDSDDSTVNDECLKERECKSSMDTYVCKWGNIWIENDVNYFIKSQDSYPTWETNINVTLIFKTVDKAIVTVSLGAGNDPIKRLSVMLSQENELWKISQEMFMMIKD
jgi:hypothetical protein